MAAEKVDAAFDPADKGPVLVHRMSLLIAHFDVRDAATLCLKLRDERTQQ